MSAVGSDNYCFPVVSDFDIAKLMIPTRCLTLPNPIRDELFGICFFRRRMLCIIIQIVIRVCGTLFTPRDNFSHYPILVSNFCLTLPNSIREEKFGNRFVHCRVVYTFIQIMIKSLRHTAGTFGFEDGTPAPPIILLSGVLATRHGHPLL